MGKANLFLKLWSDRQSTEDLKLKKQELGSRAFARGFQQNALSDAEKLFPHFKNCLIPGIEPRDLITREWMTVAGLDLAGKTRKGTCLMVVGVAPDESRRRVPLSVTFGAWNSKEVAEHVAAAIRTWGVRHTKIEDNSLQDAIIELIQMAAPEAELSGFTTSWNKRDPDIGLPSLDREFEAGLWEIADPHYEDDTCPCDYCVWKRQMMAYPAVDSADAVMALWFSREAAVELGPGFGDVMPSEEEEMPGIRESPWIIGGQSRFGRGSRKFSWKLRSI